MTIIVQCPFNYFVYASNLFEIKYVSAYVEKFLSALRVGVYYTVASTLYTILFTYEMGYYHYYYYYWSLYSVYRTHCVVCALHSMVHIPKIYTYEYIIR